MRVAREGVHPIKWRQKYAGVGPSELRGMRQLEEENRPHSALEWSTPAEFARRSRLQAAAAMSEEPESSTSERY